MSPEAHELIPDQIEILLQQFPHLHREMLLDTHYPMMVYRQTDEDGDPLYLVEHPDLPGCIAQGGTLEEAMWNLEDARYGWLEAAVLENDPIPEPNSFVKTWLE